MKSCLLNFTVTQSTINFKPNQVHHSVSETVRQLPFLLVTDVTVFTELVCELGECKVID